jgi:hypothetical protein
MAGDPVGSLPRRHQKELAQRHHGDLRPARATFTPAPPSIFTGRGCRGDAVLSSLDHWDVFSFRQWPSCRRGYSAKYLQVCKRRVL